MRVGSKILITPESEAEWRQRMQELTAQADSQSP
jgi:hypothetical protein